MIPEETGSNIGHQLDKHELSPQMTCPRSKTEVCCGLFAHRGKVHCCEWCNKRLKGQELGRSTGLPGRERKEEEFRHLTDVGRHGGSRRGSTECSLIKMEVIRAN